MNVLVTGGAGFIGSHLCEYLVAEGHQVMTVDDLSTGRLANLGSLSESPSFNFVEGSILDETLIDRCVRGADAIFHLAAAVGVKNIIERPLRSLRVNLQGTEVVVEAAARHRVRYAIASTSEIYGKNDSDGLVEEADRILGSPLKSRWSYATAKALDELVAYVQSRESDTPCVIFRLFNVVGPRQSGRYGMVLPRFVSQALAGAPITVYGDGTQRRCFGSVHDIVPAMVALLDEPEAHRRAVNLGGSQEVSILGLAERVRTLTGSSSDVTFVPYDDAYGHGYEDMHRRMPDISLAGQLIGFRPRWELDKVIMSVVLDCSERPEVPPLRAGL